jgi:hypothetical protein
VAETNHRKPARTALLWRGKNHQVHIAEAPRALAMIVETKIDNETHQMRITRRTYGAAV